MLTEMGRVLGSSPGTKERQKDILQLLFFSNYYRRPNLEEYIQRSRSSLGQAFGNHPLKGKALLNPRGLLTLKPFLCRPGCCMSTIPALGG